MVSPVRSTEAEGNGKRTLQEHQFDARAWSRDNRGMKYRIILEVDEDGVFVAECPALPGCVSQGTTREQAIANIRDAIEGYLASLKKHDEPIPPPISEEVIEVPT
jgi:antitoxin HicB